MGASIVSITAVAGKDREGKDLALAVPLALVAGATSVHFRNIKLWRNDHG
jgi:hypothetical protein